MFPVRCGHAFLLDRSSSILVPCEKIFDCQIAEFEIPKFQAFSLRSSSKASAAIFRAKSRRRVPARASGARDVEFFRRHRTLGAGPGIRSSEATRAAM